jgi:hypothetical protein
MEWMGEADVKEKLGMQAGRVGKANTDHNDRVVG